MEKSALKLEAEKVIKELNLLKLLTAHGDARVVGSVAFDLIVKLDIDIHVVVENPDFLEIVNSIYPELLNHKNIDEVRISDYRERGVKIGIDSYQGESGVWTIDIWITNRADTTGFKLVNDLKDSLTPELRETILHIKQHFHQQDLLRDGLSTLIYEAVIDKGIQTIDEFQRFLSIR